MSRVCSGGGCESCRYWNEQAQGSGVRVGLCRRHPPTYNHGVSFVAAARGHWPETAATDWCGEWWFRLPVVAAEGSEI